MPTKEFSPIFLANWKMNQSKAEITVFFHKFLESSKKLDAVLGIAPPSIYIDFVGSSIQKNSLKFLLGAQNLYFEDKGAFTGEISTLMLSDLNVDFAIIGHSERRTKFFESDELINKKVFAALKNQIRPVVCVGESSDDYKRGSSKEFVLNQLNKSLNGISTTDFEHSSVSPLMIAYEPIWAIGTGVSAKPEEANSVCELIKDFVKENLNFPVPVLYGGSTDKNNVLELYEQKSIDGFLIGNASLNAESYLSMIEAVCISV